MSIITSAVPLIAAAAYLLGALRLVCYNRGAARYRRGISLLASLFGAALCLNGLDLLLYRSPVSIWQTITAVLLCILICRFRGNVAALFRPHNERLPAEEFDFQYPPCDYCGVTPDYEPWHGSGLLEGVESRHIHACNDCRDLLPTAGTRV